MAPACPVAVGWQGLSCFCICFLSRYCFPLSRSLLPHKSGTMYRFFIFKLHLPEALPRLQKDPLHAVTSWPSSGPSKMLRRRPVGGAGLRDLRLKPGSGACGRPSAIVPQFPLGLPHQQLDGKRFCDLQSCSACADRQRRRRGINYRCSCALEKSSELFFQHI